MFLSFSIAFFILAASHLTLCLPTAESNDIEATSDANYNVTIFDEKSIEDLRQLYDEERMKRVSALLHPENNGAAQLLYISLNNNSMIEPIMEEIYKDGDPTFEGLAAFTLMQSTMTHRLRAYRKWMSLMELNSGLLKNGIILLRKLLKDEISSNPLQELIDLKARVDKYADTTLVFWHEDIRDGNFGKVVDIGSPFGLSRFGHAFDEELPKIVETVYDASAVNFEILVEFIGALRWNSHKITGLQSLFPLVTESDQQMVIGYWLKDVEASFWSRPDSSQFVQEKLNSVRDSLPENLQMLFWAKECSLQFNFDSNYLTVGSTNFDPLNRRVIAGGAASKSMFEFRPVLRNGVVRFNIWNGQHDEGFFDLHSGGNQQDDARQYISLRADQTGYNWQVELLDGVNIKVFRDFGRKERHLITDFLSPLPRTVFLWTTDVEMGDQSLSLDCIY